MIKPSTRFSSVGRIAAITAPGWRRNVRWHGAAAQCREPQFRRLRGTSPACPPPISSSSARCQHQQAFADASCHRARLFFQPVANIVQLDDQSHQTVHAHGDQNRDAGEDQDLIQERRVRDNAQRNRDDFRRQDKVGPNSAFDLIALEGFGSCAASASRRCWRTSGVSLCLRALKECSTFSTPSKQRNAPPIISNGVMARG